MEENAEKIPGEKLNEAPSINPAPAKKRSYAIPFIIIGIVLLVILFFAGGYLYSNSKKSPVLTGASPTPTLTQTQNTAVSPTTIQASPTASTSSEIVSAGAGQKKYVNNTYGFSFIFPTTMLQNEPVDVKEVGNKIYVYNTKYPYTQGQYIEIFTKTPTDTLDQAIQKQLLVNIPAKDCFVAPASADKESNFPANFEVRTLKYPVDEKSDVPAFAQTNKCPEPYATTNGLSYFLGDTKHPKVFLFFSIGQFGIEVSTPKKEGWQDTIEFLN